MRKIILASGSPRRKELLKQIGLSFEADASNYKEDMSLDMAPGKLAEFLSAGKAKEVALRHPDAIVIAADTFIALGREILGKPKSQEDAKLRLRSLSGKTHAVITGFTIIDTKSGKEVSKFVETKVHFRRISDGEIDAYLALENVMDKAGAYAIQGLAALFITKIEGDYFNIMGLPLPTLGAELKKFGVDVLGK